MPLYTITTQAGVLWDHPIGGMDLYDVLGQDRFRPTAVNPIVFAAPLLCDAQWRFVWPMLRTE
jgi:hypothetical protein